MIMNIHLSQLLHKKKNWLKTVHHKLEISINYHIELILTNLTTY